MSHRAGRTFPFVEAVALAMAAATAAFLAAHGITPTAASAVESARAGALALIVALPLGTALHLVAAAAGGSGALAYLRGVAQLGWIWGWLRLWLAVSLTSYAYFWLKLAVPITHPGSFDGALWQLDRKLHLGVAPVAWAQEALRSDALLRTLDVGYGLWLPSVVVVMAYFAASRSEPRRRAFVLSCLLLWSAGAWLYTLVPVAGPVYAYPGLFARLPVDMPIAATIQAQLGESHRAIVAGGADALARVRHTQGVAALPSLHVAFHVLFALWAGSRARLLLPFLAILAAATFVASVRTGWHYAVDGYAGALLALAVFALARRLEPERAPDEDEA